MAITYSLSQRHMPCSFFFLVRYKYLYLWHHDIYINFHVILPFTSLGVVLAFLAWIYVFKRGFETGWVKATAIAIVAILVFVMIGLAIGSFTHHIVPNAPPVIITQPFQSV
jgi:hypothetical protein